MEQSPLARRDAAREQITTRLAKLDAAVDKENMAACKRHLALLRVEIDLVVSTGDEYVREVAQIAYDAKFGKAKMQASALKR